MRFFLTIYFCVFLSFLSFSQGLMDPKNNTTRQDTLRGSITLERSWWDLNYYHLDISKNIFKSKSIKYKNIKIKIEVIISNLILTDLSVILLESFKALVSLFLIPLFEPNVVLNSSNLGLSLSFDFANLSV